MKIVSAKIISLKKHPNATKLNICEVSTGSDTFQVVCGAKNVRENMVSILAIPGAILPSGQEIKEANLRGVDSFGMLCSPIELNIEEEQGIIDLPPQTSLGVFYEDLSQKDLSSTPWYSFKLIDSHWLSSDKKNIVIDMEQKNLKEEGYKLISQTFFDGEKYLYRNYNSSFSK